MTELFRDKSCPPVLFESAPQPCPYLPGRKERKIFVFASDREAVELYDALSKLGFRRSQSFLYRPACKSCTACIPIRIRVGDFTCSKSQRRVLRKNSELKREIAPPRVDDELYRLFNDYLHDRHRDGEMAGMTVSEFADMVESSPVRTYLVKYFVQGESNACRRLAAACLTDVLEDGLSMLYSFFDPRIAKSSPGTFMVLDHVRIARAMSLEYLYLGYWVPNSRKMLYKSRFGQVDVYRNNRWCDIGNPGAYSSETISPPT